MFAQWTSVFLATVAALTFAMSGGAVGKEKPKTEVVPQVGHSNAVYSVAFSPDGRQIVSGGGWDNTVKLWDAASGALLRTLQEHSGVVSSVAFSPDGRQVLSGSRDQTLRLWDATTGAQLRIFHGHSGPVYSVAFSPSGRQLLSSSQDNTLRLWDAASGNLLRTFKAVVRQAAFSPNGRQILSGSQDKTLKLWDVASGTLLRSFEANTIYSVAFSPDGRRVLSGGDDKTLRMWDEASGALLRTFEGHLDEVYSVTFSPDGRQVLSGSNDKTLKLWDVATGALLRTFEVQSDPIHSVAFSPGGRQVLSGGQDMTLKLWDVASGALLRTFEGHSGYVTSVAFSRSGEQMLSGGKDSTLKLWDAASGVLVRTFEAHPGGINSVAFSPDGRLMLSGGSLDKTLKLWDVTSGALLHTFAGDTTSVQSVAFSPNGRQFVSGGYDTTLKLWDAATGALIRTFQGHSKAVYSVAFSPDGRQVLSGGSFDKTMKLWDASTGALIRTFQFQGQSTLPNWVIAVTFSPDGRQVLSGSFDRTLRLWDAATGALLRTFQGHSDLVWAVAFSPDGRQVLSGSGDKTLKLWNASSGSLLWTLQGHSAQVRSVAFSPDGRRVLSGGSDGTARIWSVATGQLLASSLASAGEWLVITPQGFFAGSSGSSDRMLSIVRGLDVTTIGQVHQSLFNPDLVRASLAGDPEGEVAEAAKVMNLEKVLDAGPAPSVLVMAPARSPGDIVTVEAHVEDRGKGIGRIQWRVNGVTTGITNLAPNDSRYVRQTLALDPGDNQIEVIAYEARNVLASVPTRVRVAYTGPADRVKPKLYVLAIGINKYVDQGSTSGRFAPLAGSVRDARAFAAELEKAGAGQYESVSVALALDENATRDMLDAAIDKIAADIGPRDTFVLYAAAHGYSYQGNYYMIPQDYQGGGNPYALEARAIGQDRIQEWLASRIKAKRAVILLDTCESGALTGGYTKSRTEGTVSEAAVGRLHEATGRPVITAASPGKSAYENYKGHGVFTYALIEALHKGDTNNNRKIEVSELAAHVAQRVPELFAELKQNGWVVKGLSARGSGGETQSAHFGATGEDFALVGRLP